MGMLYTWRTSAITFMTSPIRTRAQKISAFPRIDHDGSDMDYNIKWIPRTANKWKLRKRCCY